MKNVLILLILAALAWYAYGKYTAPDDALSRMPPADASRLRQPAATPAARFNCDGRTHCSAMTSCEEATYFIQHCPNTEMDGDHDGVPCETQWCK